MTKASNNGARGREGITFEGMTQNGYQAVMDRLRPIKTDIGDGNSFDHYKSRRGQDTLAFALNLQMGRSAAFMTDTAHHGRAVSQSPSILERMDDRYTGCT